MREIKINVIDWWNEDFENNYFIQFLSKRYKIVKSKNPDFLLCSCFGSEHLKYDCIKIFFTGENLTPDFNLYDYALGFDYINFESRYLRYPLFLLYQNALKKAEQKHFFDSQAVLNRGFCSFVVSNGENAAPIREYFFDELSKIGFIASGGGFRNNIGKRVEDKLEFLTHYKFNLAFENSQSRGYCTEKIIEAFAARTVPIYWGDSSLLGGGVEEVLNPKSYINFSSFSSMQEAIDYIDKINKDDKLYLEILREPAFSRKNIQEYYEEKLERFFENIFNNPQQITLSHFRKHYQNEAKRLLYIKKLVEPIVYLRNLMS